MPLWASFVGPAYRTRSENLDAETLKSLYVETITASGNAKKSNLYGTPGSRLFATVPTSGSRGAFDQDGLTLFVIGDRLYTLNLTLNAATDIGGITDDGAPVTFASNGRGGEQIAICGGGELKILDLLTMVLSAAIALPLSNAPLMVNFIDGYFLLCEVNSIRVWFSNLEDGEIWDALDFFARSQTSDNIVAIKVLKDKIWTFGSLTTEVFYDSGDLDNPFVPYPGSIIQEGTVSPWAVGVQGETIVWMSQDNEGKGRVVSATAYDPVRISTPALDFALAGYGFLGDAELNIYEQEGHPFACWSLFAAGITWCYDARESVVRGEPVWHQRDTVNFETAQVTAWRTRGLVSTTVGILIGDVETGGIYELDLDTFCDACGPIRRERTAPYASDENQWLFLDQIELGIQSGVGLVLGQGVNPVVMGEISRDGGHTWDPPVTANLGPLGSYNEPATWYQCGRVRADRFVFRVTQTDEVRCVYGPGLWLRVTPGSGQR